MHKPFDAVKVFSATMQMDRHQLGEKVTSWLQARPGIEVADIVTKQSSDAAFHCLSITVFYRDRAVAA
ncbi:MAG TPA: hypothetical protein VK427_18130 [Kofleriaceae bacterium]|nr:hypothetical protein [Kofleriaceae bacterium]